jgi:hypothetical protein
VVHAPSRSPGDPSRAFALRACILGRLLTRPALRGQQGSRRPPIGPSPSAVGRRSAPGEEAGPIASESLVALFCVGRCVALSGLDLLIVGMIIVSL